MATALRRMRGRIAVTGMAAMLVFATGICQATTIHNIATVRYALPNQPEPATLTSNRVSTEVLPLPTPAELEFLRYDPGSAGTRPIAIDGGKCRAVDGRFIPLPPVHDLEGGALDGDIAEVGSAPGYYVGEPVVVSVADVNRNADPAVRDYVEVDISTATDDIETLRLQETGVDTAVFAGAIQSTLMPPDAVQYDCVLSLLGGTQLVARYTDTDFPLDAVAVAAASYDPLDPAVPVLRLEQVSSRDFVELGDFVQFTLVVTNVHDGLAVATTIHNKLPPGFRYRSGSLRVGPPAVDAASIQPALADTARAAGVVPGPGLAATADPVIAADGRSMVIPVGDLPAGMSANATFVAEVGSGVTGEVSINNAIARANKRLASNPTEVVMRRRESLMTSTFTLVGRVVQGACGDDEAAAVPVPGVRVVLQDGSFVVTDASGAYHFPGLEPGTHVVQLDVATLPPGVEPADCGGNTRSAGRSYSQFVEAQGGTLWRADFRLRAKAPLASELGIGMRLEPEGDRHRLGITLDSGAVPVSDVRAMVVLPEGSRYVAGSARLDGQVVDDPQLTGNIAIFDLGDPGAAWRRRLDIGVTLGKCPAADPEFKGIALFDTPAATGLRTPPATLVVPCDSPPGPIEGVRATTPVSAAAEGPAASPFSGDGESERVILDDATAAGAGDPARWLVDQAPGHAFVFPATGYNPRSPITRAVFKHLPGESVTMWVNGEKAPPLSDTGATTNAAKTVKVRVWTNLPLRDGDNILRAVVTDKQGREVASVDHVVHYANAAARVELVPEASLLVADGLRNPVIAVRLLDRDGYPVRKGVSGEYSLSGGHVPAEQHLHQQQRQLAGMDGASPTWSVAGDDGIAYIALAPTSAAGEVTLGFEFGADGNAQRIRAWLEPVARDWIVVGFARGTLGYDTLDANMQALGPEEDGKGVRGEGQVSFYAKGRVLGEWLMTVAYDSDKDTARLKREGLLSAIDPQQYYTLYGDGTARGHDAASAEKLYLKLERDQFYALFGDFQTGLDRGELSRYQRTLNGMKVEYHGPLFEFTGFAARTSQNYARDEIPGDGTSGLYRLSHAGILINSERVRIETRARHHSEQIVQSRELQRHVDYDIDYERGTLFFREPVASRDFDFNPNWIVVEYETVGTAEEFLDAGGRAGVRLLDGRLEAGVTYIRDEERTGDSRLAAIDARMMVTQRDEVRAEFAATRSTGGDSDVSGSAWLVEWDHRGERLDLLAYARRQGPGFGLGQQNGTESGMAKAGVQGSWRLNDNLSLQGEAYGLENLASETLRHAARLELAHRGTDWSARGGLQWARDEAPGGKVAESRQVTLGADRQFFDRRLNLSVQADIGLDGGNDSVDFPNRFQLGAAYRVNDALQVVAAQEFTDGETHDTSTTRIGLETTPWANAQLTSTLNQSQISEYGPRTFALFGLRQKFLVGEHWGFDVSLDSSHSFNASGEAPIMVDPAMPVAPGGIRDGGALTGEFTALSGGATYRADLWSWNARVEGRQGDTGDRYGVVSSFLRQAHDGVAFAASVQAFSQHNSDGSTGLLGDAQLAWAYRPFGSNWSILDKLEYRVDELERGGDGASDFRSSRLINNFVLNYVSDAWASGDAHGNVLDLQQRSQFSLYYGSKYVLDTFGADDFAGYTDVLGAEARFDLTTRIDLGFRASVLHSWDQGTVAWAFGPNIGFSPFTNAWVTVGYNMRGFDDRDFEDAYNTAEGLYLVLRMKFDQETLGLVREDARQER